MITCLLTVKIFFLLILGCKFVSSAALLIAPKPPPTMHDKILHECPRAEALIGSGDESKVFAYCGSWSEIETPHDNKTLLCLIYYNSFLAYCQKADKQHTTNAMQLPSLTVDAVCEKIATLPGLKAVIGGAEANAKCIATCKDDMGYPKHICALSYYYLNLTDSIGKIPVVKNDASTDVQTNVHPESRINTDNNVSVNRSSDVVAPAEIAVGLPDRKSASVANAAVIKPDDARDESSLVGPPPNQSIHVVESSSKSQSNQVGTAPAHSDAVVNVVADQQSAKVIKDSAVAVADSNRADQRFSPDSADADTPGAPQQAPPADLPEEDQNAAPINNDLGDGENRQSDVEFDENPGLQSNNINIAEVKSQEVLKPNTLDESINYKSEIDNESYFFSYFMVLCLIFIVGYVGYHNKQKILALVVEGRRGRSQYRNRRPNSANYHKLDSNLEEAILSSVPKNSNNVIY